MGKTLIAHYYEFIEDLILEENGYYDDFDMAYQNIKFCLNKQNCDDRANDFKGSLHDLLLLISSLTSELLTHESVSFTSEIESEETVSHTIKYLWIVYCELKDFGWDYVRIYVV